MSNLFSKFATSENQLVEGIKIQIEEAIFTVAHAGQLNNRWLRITDTVYKPYRHQIKTDTLPKAKEDELEIEIFVQACLLNWENVCGRDGKLIPYSKDNARELLRELPYLLQVLRQVAADAANYREGDVEADAKN